MSLRKTIASTLVCGFLLTAFSPVWAAEDKMESTFAQQYGQILQSQFADINGDGYKDRIMLTGQKEGKKSDLVKNVKVVIKNGKTKNYTDFSVGKNSSGYEPKLFLGDFNGDDVEDMLVSLATGGSGGTYNYSLFSCRHNKIISLFDQEKFSAGLKFTVKFKDNYKLNLYNEDTKKNFSVDLSSQKKEYRKIGLYNKKGKLLKTTFGMVDGFSKLDVVDVNKDGTYELVGYQTISGAAHADTLGQVKSTWKWQNGKMSLTKMNITIAPDKTINK